MRLPCAGKLLVLACAALAAAFASQAAEFDVDSGQILLRRLRLCADCGSPLLVTRVHPGVMVRCPDCGREQARLRDEYLITQIYQLCRLCQAPLDSRGCQPGDSVECGNCHTRQTLGHDAFPPAAMTQGKGYLPGQPPGSGPKKLLFDSGAGNAMAAAGAAVQPELPSSLPDPSWPANAVPLDLGPERPKQPLPVMPSPQLRPPAPEETALAAPQPSLVRSDSSEQAAALLPAPEDAVEVPAVTLDLFGAPDKAQTVSAAGGGAVLARVNGKPIRAESVDVIVQPLLETLRARAGAGGDKELAAKEKALRSEILDRLIDRELVYDEAVRMGYKPDQSEVRKRAAELQPRLAGSGLNPEREAGLETAMEAMRRRFGEKPEAVSPEQVRAFYQEHKNEWLQPGGIAVATLTIFRDRLGRADQRDYRAIAQDLSRQLEGGARFDELRAKHDEFPPPAGEMTPPLLPEAYYAEEIRVLLDTLRPGAVFGPVFMPGLALFGKTTEIRKPEPIPFREVEKEIRRRLGMLEAEREFSAWLERTRKAAAVEIY